MTTLSSEAERLADKCARWDISDSDKDNIAALLRRIPELEAERDQLRAALATPSQAQQPPYAWAVSGLTNLFTGPHAEYDARQEAKHCGGTADAFPLFRAAQPVHGVPDARRIALTIIEDLEGRRGVLDGVDDDVKQEMLDTFAEIIEAASPTPPAQQPAGDVVRNAERYRQLRNGSSWPAVFASADAPEPLRGAELDAALASSARKGE